MDLDVHTPILADTVLDLLDANPGKLFIDATVDGGGHTQALLARTAPEGKILGIDRDSELLELTRRRLCDSVARGRLTLVHGDFRNLEDIAGLHGFAEVDGILFDLGLSSYHFDRSGRGFSFGGSEPLDMRFDPGDADSESAAEILARRREEELARLLFELGEERYSRRIARAIVRRREKEPVRLACELYELTIGALPGPARRHGDRSAARVFQALRIAANRELEAIEEALPQALRLLRPGGRLVVLAFHSLEDRIVKNFLRSRKQAGEVDILTKKPLRASDEEVGRNPRAASAKLRAARKTSTTPMS
jgi:16S rRNA (cytosine1402-N4)-methyltransferase